MAVCLIGGLVRSAALAADGAEVPAEAQAAAAGMAYELRMLTEPRVVRAHVLRVNLAAGGLSLAVLMAPDPDGAGPAEAALTDPRLLAVGSDVLAFVNANPWDGFPDAQGVKDRAWRENQPVTITGWAVSNGLVRSASAPRGTGAVWMDANGRVSIGSAPASNDAVMAAVEGWGQIVKDGVVLRKPGGMPAPRTGLGVDPAGGILWIVVTDGRQEGFSDGMTIYELALFMRDLGCWSAAVMDGGGSSVLGMRQADGALKIMNSPSDRFLGLARVRPLPLVLAVRRAPATGSGSP
jgi:hypothetical protein